MVGNPPPSAAIITDPEILPELVRPLVMAFEAAPYDAAVDTGGVGHDRDPAWLLPTRVTVQVGLSPLMFHLLQDLKIGSRRSVPAALATLYAEIEARYGGAAALASRRSLGLGEFHPRPRQVFRFVFGLGLQSRDISYALGEVPATFQAAIERCRRNEDLLESFAGGVGSQSHERALELVYLYEGPVYGWETIA